MTLAILACTSVQPDSPAPIMCVFLNDKLLDRISLPSIKPQWKFVHIPKSYLTEEWTKLRIEMEATDKELQVVFHQLKISADEFSSNTYQLGALEDFSSSGSGRRYLNWQWVEPQAQGTWLVGNSGRMQMHLKQMPAGDLKMRFHATAFLSEEVPRRTIKIYSMDNQCLGEYIISNANYVWYDLRIPQQCLQGNYLCLRFEINSSNLESFGKLDIFLHAVQIDDSQKSYSQQEYLKLAR